MQVHGLGGLIVEHPFFAGMAPEHCDLIGGCARNVRFDPSEYLFREGEPANEFFLIRHGRVALEIMAPGRGPLRFLTVNTGRDRRGSVARCALSLDLRRAGTGVDARVVDRRPMLARQMRRQPRFRLRDDEAFHGDAGAAPARRAAADPRCLRPQRLTPPMVPVVAQVRGRRRETRDTWTLAIDAGGLEFRPGQFNMLYAYGIGEIPVSVSGDPGTPGPLFIRSAPLGRCRRR